MNEIITIGEVIANAPARWRRQYGRTRKRHCDKQDIGDLLDRLNPPTKATVDAIIGNTSWTELQCDVCKEEKERLVYIKTKASSEYGEDAICETCLENALTTLRGSK